MDPVTPVDATETHEHWRFEHRGCIIDLWVQRRSGEYSFTSKPLPGVDLKHSPQRMGQLRQIARDLHLRTTEGDLLWRKMI